MMTPRNKVMRPPLEPGFMRSGFFAWPTTLVICEKCGAEFGTTGNAVRCFKCRAKHKVDRRKYDNPGGVRRRR